MSKEPPDLLPQHGPPDKFLDHTLDVVAVYSRDLRYTFINRRGASLLGRPRQEIIGRTNRELMGDRAEEIEPHLRRVLQGWDKVVAIHELQGPLGPVTLETRLSPVQDSAGEVLGIVGVSRDVTRDAARTKRLETLAGRLLKKVRSMEKDLANERESRRKLAEALESENGLLEKEAPRAQEIDDEAAEEETQRERRMESVSTLAGGMAHQFNNALSAVTGNLDLMNLDLLNVDPPVRKTLSRYTERIKDSVDRMGRLTRQLLAYARGGRYSPALVPFSTYVRYNLSLLGHTIPSSITLDTEFSSEDRKVEIDTNQLQMVLSSVLLNAVESIEGKGAIRVSTGTEDFRQKDPHRPRGLRPGSYVYLMVEDTGEGMDEATRARIFEPFFSTKFQGRGLGMAAVYGVVRNHGGWVSVDSTKGAGTRVKIWLPAQDVTPETVPLPHPAHAAEGSILVIEDEVPVMDVFRTALERMGYSVLEAPTGRKALEIASDPAEMIKMAVLDILLPDMDGRALYPSLVSARPGLKVIVSSGYAVEGPAQEILDAGAQAFLPKPFSLVELREALRKVLGEAPPLLGENPGPGNTS